MKKMILALTVGLMTSAMAFADEDTGALGFGLISESKQNSVVGGSIRGALFLDAGTQLYGPFHYGFELQGDVKRMSQNSFTISRSDITAFSLGGGDWVLLVTNSQYKQTYTLWDLDFSPRGYFSFDMGNKIQILGFAGLNYNWQTLDYTVKNTGGTPFTFDGDSLDPGDEKTISHSFDGIWQAVAGFRFSLGFFYVDYTRFIDLSSDDISWDNYNKDRIGAGINLRF